MKDKDNETEDIKTGEKGAAEQPEKKLSEAEQIEILKEINSILSKDLEFYKEQLNINTEKLKKVDEMVKNALLTEQKHKEMQLDYENLKKRSAEKIAVSEEEGVIKSVKAILPTVDNFRRAIVSIPDQNVVSGLKMIYKQLMEALGKLDVEEIPALGLQFDPDIHNAVMQVDDPEKESGTVVEVLQKGYIKGDKVIRYTQVKIAK